MAILCVSQLSDALPRWSSMSPKSDCSSIWAVVQAIHCHIVPMLLFKVLSLSNIKNKFIKSYCLFSLYLQYEFAPEAIFSVKLWLRERPSPGSRC